MAKLSQAQEPSMEEILASIRRIISDEEATGRDRPAPPLSVVSATAGDRKPGPSSAAAPPASSPKTPLDAVATSAADDSAILELTEADVSASLSVPLGMEREMDVAFADTPRPAAHPTPVTDAAPPPSASEAREERAAPVAAERDSVVRSAPAGPAQPGPTAAPQDVPMVSEPLLSRRSDEAVNSAFNHLAHTMLSANARTLEDLVKEMMRPMLKTWLDDNLPPLVERLVREEIERVSRGGRR